ncbi:MAG: hypothetical protein Hyperionvirus11_70 [Hyperionvirus sp.]|uniref:Uncharacterized protein n=1 Tax=Hyperionvirus sp. TaxID=2487770 RepID=A0A3G5A957_9VIRU|nr:MAG: hypothetical protein Hyperionvirus11_70 [Hyperionvirus sp.]
MDIWNTILNHEGEIKSIPIYGSKTLVNIRADIAPFDKGMTETIFLIDLQHLIGDYTALRNWHFDDRPNSQILRTRRFSIWINH